jgi:hypothetical protein
MLLEKKNAVIYGAGGAVGGAVARAFAREGQGSSLPVTPEHPSRRWLRRSPRLEEWPRRRTWTHSTSFPSRSTSAKW